MDFRKQVLDTINRVYNNDLTTSSGGNISAMDTQGTIYITPSSVDKGTLKEEDIVAVSPSGEKNGKHEPSMELPFHSNIYRLRSDLRATVHAHPPALVAYATAKRIPDLNCVVFFKNYLKKVSGSKYALPGSLKLGGIVSEEFKKGYDSVMMDNHGAVACGKDLTEAFLKFEALDYCARILMNAQALGGVSIATCNENIQNLEDYEYSYEKDEAIASEMISFITRSYRKNLFCSAFGYVAVKSEKGFYVNLQCDLPNISTKDIVFVPFGRQLSSRYYEIIRSIMEKNEQVKSVFIGMPPSAMGFAVAHKHFNARLIPESYIMLREVVNKKCGTSPQEIAQQIGVKNPVMILENECCITVGKNLAKTFDRLEVLDFSARSVISARQVSEIVPINDEETQEIEDTFNGW